MTGPPYPPLPGPGSNAIGKFVIGVGQIGDIPEFNYWVTIISQYANSPIMIGMIDNWFTAINPTENLSNFFDNIWNVDTALTYGLDVWGRIVGVNRVLQVPNVFYFGFKESLPGILSFNSAGQATYIAALGFAEAKDPLLVPFNQAQFGTQPFFNSPQLINGIFYNGESTTNNFALSDEAYRKLILAKAMFNITNGSIAAINRILMYLFPNRGNAYVTDGFSGPSYFGFQESVNAFGFNQEAFYDGEGNIATMTMTYTFNFALQPFEIAIVEQSGVLPKPAGVSSSVVIL